MSSEPAAPISVAPDRLFARAAGVVLAAGLAAILGAFLSLDHAVRRQGAAAERAMISADEAASAREVVAALDRLMLMPDGDALHTTRTRLGWAIERLIADEARRIAMMPQAPVAASRADLMSTARDALGRLRDPGLTPEETARLRSRLEAQVLPQLDLIAQQDRTAAETARHRSRSMLAAALALLLMGGAAIVAGVVLPARRRISAWVLRTNEADRENRFRLLHDALTRMPNATYLHAYLARLAVNAARSPTQTAVLRVELDKFQMLRETLGQRTCDEIIRITARRIQHVLRTGDFAAYLGHDDFAVVASELEDANAAAGIAHRLQSALGMPFSIRGGARRIGASIGVTLLSDDQADTDRILANAAIALSEAKGAGSGNIRYFRESLRLEVDRRETLFTELLAGLDTGQIIPFFQPQVDLATGDFSGFEALVRWEHPRHGLLTPAAFLDFADQTDLTERLGEEVLTRSLAAIQAWDAAGLVVPKVGINFALAQLRDPRLIEKIKWEVERHDIDPARLAIEVLETVLIKSDADLVVRNLRGLASAGFQIELDDFGTGHASISNLRRFMVNRIKIDRSFIFGIETSAEQQKLTATMIAMARALGIHTLAEGVETEDAEAMLRRLGCDHFQGYVLARPMSVADTFDWLRAFRARPYDLDVPRRPPQADPNTA